MNKHTLTIMGGSHEELRIPATVLCEALTALLEGARLATRFVVEGESSRPGTRPAWLDAACAADITGLTPGSAVLEVEARPLREVDAARFAPDPQGSLFVEDDGLKIGEHTAIDLFGQILSSVVDGDVDDVLADRALLDACVNFASISGGGFAGVRLDGLRSRADALIITPAHVAKFEAIRDETPVPQAVRLTGKLDTISASRSNVMLTLTDGTQVAARVEEHDPATLRDLFDTRVVVSGIAHYHPSGRIRLLIVESIAEASAGDRLFETIPTPQRSRAVFAPVIQDSSTGASALFGTWPGDESDEELLQALRVIG